jgi:beta-mannosidase
LRDNRARVLAKEERECEVSALSAMEVLTWEIGSCVETLEDRRSRYLEYSLWADDEVISAGTTLFVRPKEFSFERVNVKAQVSVTMRSEGGADAKADIATPEISGHERDFRITVTADAYCKSVCLSLKDYDGVFSDNWFDIHGGEPVILWLKRTGELEGLCAADVERQLKIQHY